VSLPFFPFLF
jgi:hypothetical protein